MTEIDLQFDKINPQKSHSPEELKGGLPQWEKEWLAIKEKQWETDLGLLVISGKPGAGTSSAAKILASLYKSELYKAGDTIREMAGSSERASGFIKRDPRVDHKVDERIRKMTYSAKRGQPAIAEAQIGAATALETIQELERNGRYSGGPIIRVLFWATKKERVKRLKMASDAGGENKTYDEIWEDTSGRERDDLTYWRELYPNLIGNDNPLEKGALDAKGNPIYNTPTFDNTLWESADRSAYEVHKYLSEMGLVRPVLQMNSDTQIFLEYPLNNFPDDISIDLDNPF